MSKNILVTGAAGFIGSSLCEELISRGHFVVGIDNFFRGKEENIVTLKRKSNFAFKKLDLSDSNSTYNVRSLVNEYRITEVFHLAAVNGTQYFYDKSMFVLNQNVCITQNLLLAIRNTRVNNIIYTSSSEVYGEPQQVPTPETHPILLNALADRDSYAASKALGDFYVRLFAEKTNTNCLILRVFNMYGERMINTRYGQVVPEFVRRMLFEDQFTVIGDGHHTRSFCYIKDAAWAMVELMEKQVSGILNLGNNAEITILALAEKLHALINKPFQPVFLPERPHDHKRRCPDLSKLNSILPNMKWTELTEGLKNVINFEKQKMDSSIVV